MTQSDLTDEMKAARCIKLRQALLIHKRYQSKRYYTTIARVILSVKRRAITFAFSTEDVITCQCVGTNGNLLGNAIGGG